MFEYVQALHQIEMNDEKSEFKINGEDHKVIKIYDFDAKLQRMSVVAQHNDVATLLVKGSPEIIKKLCKPETIPETFEKSLESMTKQGFRVICFATKPMDLKA